MHFTLTDYNKNDQQNGLKHLMIIIIPYAVQQTQYLCMVDKMKELKNSETPKASYRSGLATRT